MGRGYTLINVDKKEKIGFGNVNTGTKLRELSGTIVASSIITYYLLTNIGDKISFIDDHQISFTLFEQTYDIEDFDDFKDVTDDVIEELIENKIFRDDGILWIDKEEDLYYRDLTNIWDSKVTKAKG